MSNQLGIFLKRKQLEWEAEQFEINPKVKLTAKKFAGFLKMPPSTLSELKSGKEPSDLQIKRIARRYPEVYDVIGRPELRQIHEEEKRGDWRLRYIVEQRNKKKLDDADMERLVQVARQLTNQEGEGDDQDEDEGDPQLRLSLA